MWLCCIISALREARVVVSFSEMSVRSSITITSICMERLFAHIGNNTRLLTVSPASEVIETQQTMADLVCLSSNQWTADGLEPSQESSDFAARSASHDMHYTYNTHNTHNMHNMHNTHDVSFTGKIYKAESIRFSSKVKTSVTAGFQPTKLRTTEYVTNRIRVINDSLELMFAQAIN